MAYAFVHDVLPRLERDGLSPWVYYVASAELFDLLPEDEQARLYPEERAQEAMGITGFTLPTMDRWIRSPGRAGGRRSIPTGGATSWAAARATPSWRRPASTGSASTAAVRRYIEARRPAAAGS